MNNLLSLYIIYLFSFLSTHAQEFTKTSETDKTIVDLLQFTKRIQTIESDFTDTKQLSILKDPLISKGKLYYLSPTSLRWEQNIPNSVLFISNENKTEVYENGVLNSNTSSKFIIQKIKNLILFLINGNYKDNNKFSVQYYKSPNSIRIDLFPLQKQMQKNIGKIELLFNIENFYLSEIIFYQNTNDKNTIKFENQIINNKINPSKFDFK